MAAGEVLDASAIEPLLVAEQSTLAAAGACCEGFRDAGAVGVECVSALARLERDGALSARAMTLALQRLRQLSAGWHEVDLGG